MQDITRPTRGTIRPVARTTPQRAYPSTRRSAASSPASAPVKIASPSPTPTTSHPIASQPTKPQPQVTHLAVPKPAKTLDAHPNHRLPKALSRTAHKLQLIHRLHERQQQPLKAKTTIPGLRALKQLSKRSLAAGIAIALILIVTGLVSYDTWQTNNRAKQAFTEDAPMSEVSSTSADRQSNEGKDESALPKNALANYKVAPNLPRALYIEKLNIAARVLPMGVNDDGSMQAPLGIYDAGWYSGSARPGETGAMVLNGHSSGPTRQGLLGKLDALKEGDEIVLEKGDATRLRYKVVHSETLPLQDVDMNKVSLPYGTAKNGLNIYTCTGSWLPEKQTFDHRVIVYAVEV